MARPQRPDRPGGWFHVINRGADRQDIFSSDSDFVLFEELFADAVERERIEVHAYSLMTNHFHALIHTPVGGLSGALQSVQSRYASAYNQRHDRSGALFEGRFTSVIIDGPSQRHLTARYIHRNALDIVPSAALAAYRWSSFGVYTGARPAPPWLTMSEVSAQFGGDAHGYRRYVEQTVPSDRQADRRARSDAGLQLEHLRAVVALVMGIDPHEILDGGRRRRNDARLAAIMLAVELRVSSTAAIARHFSLGSPASVRATARRGRVRCDDDELFAAVIRRVRGSLFGRAA